MDASPPSSLGSPFTEVSERLSCPLRSCSKGFKKLKKKTVLKHFKKRHPETWVLICAHCLSYATRKLHHMVRHVKDNHSDNDLPYSCTCFSSCQLKKAKFESTELSLKYCCNTCQYIADSVTEFNIHVGIHDKDESELKDRTLSELSTNEVNAGKQLEEGGAESPITSTPPFPKSTAKTKVDTDLGMFSTELDQEANKSHLISRLLYSSNEFEKIGEGSNPNPTAIHPCPVCGKYFTRKRSIKAHMVVHGDERDFHCGQCPYQAKRKGDLEIHIRTYHNQDRPFTCSHCGMQFAFKTNLTRHLRKHSGDKPYKCNVCDKQFSQSFNVLRHIKRHHSL